MAERPGGAPERLSAVWSKRLLCSGLHTGDRQNWNWYQLLKYMY